MRRLGSVWSRPRALVSADGGIRRSLPAQRSTPGSRNRSALRARGSTTTRRCTCRPATSKLGVAVSYVIVEQLDAVERQVVRQRRHRKPALPACGVCSEPRARHLSVECPRAFDDDYPGSGCARRRAPRAAARRACSRPAVGTPGRRDARAKAISTFATAPMARRSTRCAPTTCWKPSRRSSCASTSPRADALAAGQRSGAVRLPTCGRGGMVDAGDLKSPGLCSCRFESGRPHHLIHNRIAIASCQNDFERLLVHISNADSSIVSPQWPWSEC